MSTPDKVPDNASKTTQHTARELLANPDFQALARRKNAISRNLTVIIGVLYFGFIFLLAYSPDTLKPQVGGATLGIPLGIGVIIGAWILTGIYVRWANSGYDAMVADFKSRLKD